MLLIHSYCIILPIINFVKVLGYPKIDIIAGLDPPSYSYLDRVLIDSDDGYRYIRLNVYDFRIIYFRKITSESPFVITETVNAIGSPVSPPADIQVIWSTVNWNNDFLMLHKYVATARPHISTFKCSHTLCKSETCDGTPFKQRDNLNFANVITFNTFYETQCVSPDLVTAIKIHSQGSPAIARFHRGYHLPPSIYRTQMPWHEAIQAYDLSFDSAALPKKVVIKEWFIKNGDLSDGYRKFLDLNHGLNDLKTARFNVKRMLLDERFEFVVDERPHSPLFVFDDKGCNEYYIQLKIYLPKFIDFCIVNIRATKEKYEIYGKDSSSKMIVMRDRHLSTTLLKLNMKTDYVQAVYGFESEHLRDACFRGFDEKYTILAFEVAKREINENKCLDDFNLILRYRVVMVKVDVKKKEVHLEDGEDESEELETTKEPTEEKEEEVAEASLIPTRRKFNLWMLLVIVFVILILIIETIIFWICIPTRCIVKTAQKVPCLRRFYTDKHKAKQLTAAEMKSMENKSHGEQVQPDGSTTRQTPDSANQGSPNSPAPTPSGQLVVMQHTTKTSRTTDSLPEPPTLMGKAFSSRHRRWSNYYEKKPDFKAAQKTDFSKISRKLILPDFLYQLLPVAKFTKGKIAAEQEDQTEPNSRVYFYLRDAMTEEHSIFGKFAVRVAEPFSNDDIPANIRERDPSSLRKTPFYVMKVYILSKDPPGFEIHYRGHCPFFLQALACENCDTVLPQYGRSKLNIMSLYMKDIPAGYHYHASVCLGDDDNDLSKYVNIFAYRAHRKHQEVKTGVTESLHLNSLNLEPIHESQNMRFSAELKRIEVPEGGKQVKVMVDRADLVAETPKATEKTQGTQTQPTQTEGDKKAKSLDKVQKTEKLKSSLDKTQPMSNDKEKKSKSKA